MKELWKYWGEDVEGSKKIQKEDFVKEHYRCTSEKIGLVTRNVYTQLSGLEDEVFNDFIKDDCIPQDD